MKPLSKDGKSYTELKKEFIQLKKEGLTIQDIAKRLNINRATVGVWHRAMKNSDYEIIRKAMITRLKALTENPQTPIREITDLTNSLASIEKRIQNLE